MTVERWRPVLGYEGIYEVSDHGRVRRIAGGKGAVPGRVLRFAVDRKGYRRVTLTVGYQQNRKGVHRLVAEAFVGLPADSTTQCNHLDGDKHNNHVSNLEWTTPSQNMRHAFATGLKVGLAGEENGRAKLTRDQVDAIKALAGSEPKVVTARRFGISDVRVGQIQRSAAA